MSPQFSDNNVWVSRQRQSSHQYKNNRLLHFLLNKLIKPKIKNTQTNKQQQKTGATDASKCLETCQAWEDFCGQEFFIPCCCKRLKNQIREDLCSEAHHFIYEYFKFENVVRLKYWEERQFWFSFLHCLILGSAIIAPHPFGLCY